MTTHNTVRLVSVELGPGVLALTLDLGAVHMGPWSRWQLDASLREAYQVRSDWTDGGQLVLTGRRAAVAADALRVALAEAVQRFLLVRACGPRGEA